MSYSDEDDGDDNEEREFIARDEDARDFQGRAARQGGVGGAEMKTTVRNLRIREDTPKYLRNLALDRCGPVLSARPLLSSYLLPATALLSPPRILSSAPLYPPRITSSPYLGCSAHYDPKARSMRANPFPNENPEELAFAGDNFVRFTGDALTMAQTQVRAKWGWTGVCKAYSH